MAEVQITKDLENNTLVIEYVAKAPKEKAWKAYSEKEWFEKWWGPEGWETTTKEFNFKSGGRVHYIMKCVDENQTEWFGKESAGLMDIQSIVEGETFTYKDYFSDEKGTRNTEMPVLTITNEFIEEDGTTRIVCRCVGDSAEQIEQLIEMGMLEGFKSQLNKLDDLLTQE